MITSNRSLRRYAATNLAASALLMLAMQLFPAAEAVAGETPKHAKAATTEKTPCPDPSQAGARAPDMTPTQQAAGDVLIKLQVLHTQILGLAEQRAEHNASGKEVFVTMRLFALIDRMMRRIDIIAQNRDSDLVAGARDGVLRDFRFASSTIEGLLNGSTELGVGKVDDAQASEILVEVRKGMAELDPAISAFSKASP